MNQGWKLACNPQPLCPSLPIESCVRKVWAAEQLAQHAPRCTVKLVILLNHNQRVPHAPARGVVGQGGAGWRRFVTSLRTICFKLAPKGNALSPSFLFFTPSPASSQQVDTWAGTMAQSRAVGVQGCVCIESHGT